MIIDSAPGTGCPTTSAVRGTDFAILISEPTPSGFEDMKRALTVVDHFQIPYGVVVNKWDINPALSAKIEKWAKDKFLGKISYDKRIFKKLADFVPIVKSNLPAKKEIEKIAQKVFNMRKGG